MDVNDDERATQKLVPVSDSVSDSKLVWDWIWDSVPHSVPDSVSHSIRDWISAFGMHTFSRWVPDSVSDSIPDLVSHLNPNQDASANCNL